MQPWINRGIRGLFCASQASQASQASLRIPARGFTTTPVYERSPQGQKRLKKLEQRMEEKLRKAKARAKAGGALDDFSNRNSSKLNRQLMLSNNFPALVTSMLRELKHEQSSSDPEEIALWKKFERHILTASQLTDDGTSAKMGSLIALKRSMQRAYQKRGNPGLRRELEYLLYAFDLNTKFSEPSIEAQQRIADLRHPAEWYPSARSMQRTIHLHVGPTNSGKTYHALKRLEASKSGFYAGPLRLLAQEVYHRFSTSGIPCSLVTGDDVKTPEGGGPATITSNTVEMVSLGAKYDVGVIDEIQMIADENRGWAWTRALLGARARELHLCGEVRAVPLIRALAALTGDKLEIHRYERLNPLKVMNQSLRGDLKKLQKGDCVVSFSRVGIHALKNDIEKITGRRAAMVYGGLPAEIRTQQAALFNDPDNDYDFLVASDAIGMGLNLACKRIIFETVVKRLPTGLARLTIPEIKQIGGRAGRYRTAAQQDESGKIGRKDDSNVGLVTCLEEIDLPYIQEAFDTEPPPLSAAGIHPPDSAYEKFAAYFPKGISLEYMIRRLTEICKVDPLFFMCETRHLLENAEVVDAVPSMQLIDQLTLMAAPIIVRDDSNREAAIAFAACVAEHNNGRLLDIPALDLEILEEKVTGDKGYMQALEALHRSVILYSWLSFRFGGIFTDRTLAIHVKQLVEERMVRALTEFSANKKLRKDASLHRQIALQKQMLEEKQYLEQTGGGERQSDPNELAFDDEESPETDIGVDREEYEGERVPGETREGELDDEGFEDEFTRDEALAFGDWEDEPARTETEARDGAKDPATRKNEGDSV
ncbi:putative mitochondrial ATP-dependent RNA helicase Suv3 [Aspergillus unguis]